MSEADKAYASGCILVYAKDLEQENAELKLQHEQAIEQLKSYEQLFKDATKAVEGNSELKRIIADSQKQKPVYSCEWPTSGGDSPDYISTILIDRDEPEGELDYQTATKHGFKLTTLFASPVMLNASKDKP